MLKLVKKLAKVVFFINEKRPGVLHEKQIAVLFTYPTGVNKEKGDKEGIFILPDLIEEKLLFKGAQAFTPDGDVGVGEVASGEVAIRCDFILSCTLVINFARHAPGTDVGFSNEFRLTCSLWNRAGENVCERVHRAYVKSCEPSYGDTFHELAEQVANFVQDAIFPPEATAA